MTILEIILNGKSAAGSKAVHSPGCRCPHCRNQTAKPPYSPRPTAHQYWRQRRKARLNREFPEEEAELWSRRTKLPLSHAKKYRLLSDLKKFRGSTFQDSPRKKYTLARLSIPGQPVYYGVSAHGQKMYIRPNAISRSHAEGDVFNQAARHPPTSRYGMLVVDRPPCRACGVYNGILSMARQIGLKVIDIVHPKSPFRERYYLK